MVQARLTRRSTTPPAHPPVSGEHEQARRSQQPAPTSPAHILGGLPGVGRANGPLRQTAVQQMQQAMGNRAARHLVQRLSTPAAPPPAVTIQRVYLWDRQRQAQPIWSNDVPDHTEYLESGTHDDKGAHGLATLYVRLNSNDILYGLAEDLPEEDGEKIEGYMKNGLDEKQAVKQFVKDGGKMDREFYKEFYGGKRGEDAQDALGDTKMRAFYVLNADVAPHGDDLTDRCIVAMAYAIRDAGSVRFVLDGLKNIKGILEGSKYMSKVTSHELRFAVANLNKVLKVPGKNEADEPDQVVFKANQTVFFYLNGKLVAPDTLATMM